MLAKVPEINSVHAFIQSQVYFDGINYPNGEAVGTGFFCNNWDNINPVALLCEIERSIPTVMLPKDIVDRNIMPIDINLCEVPVRIKMQTSNELLKRSRGVEETLIVVSVYFCDSVGEFTFHTAHQENDEHNQQ